MRIKLDLLGRDPATFQSEARRGIEFNISLLTPSV